MNDSTFLCLTYIYLMLVKDKYSKIILQDFKKQVFKLLKYSYCITDFRHNLLSDSLSMPYKEYKLRSNFSKFLGENNKLLGYKF